MTAEEKKLWEEVKGDLANAADNSQLVRQFSNIDMVEKEDLEYEEDSSLHEPKNEKKSALPRSKHKVSLPRPVPSQQCWRKTFRAGKKTANLMQNRTEKLLS